MSGAFFIDAPQNETVYRYAMNVLGIETSCDETAAAIVNAQTGMVAQRLLSQTEEHAPYGGVVPEIASRAHMDHLDRLIAETMKEAGMDYADLDGIAATAGPGLIGGVIVGVMTAKAIASVHNKPFIAVNHLEGHALTVRIPHSIPDAHVEFPYLMLLVSGGHCQFLVVEGVGRYHYLGGTLDDALGEAFDKTAKMLGLGYPGGPKVEALAREGDAKRFTLPKPLCNRKICDFSFSGLKTAVRTVVHELRGGDGITQQDKADICASFQYTVGEVVTSRLKYAVQRYRELHPDGTMLVLAGGVAANQYLCGLLEGVAKNHGLTMVSPPIALCTDNAAMIAWAGLERLRLGQQNNLDFAPRARWPLAELAA